MDLDDSTWEEEVLDHSIDLSGFYLDLVVNRMQGLQFYQNRLVITPHLIAMGGMEHAGHDKDERDQIWDDVILLHEVESVQDMNTESELDDRGFHDAQGLIAIRTTADGRNRGVCVGVCVYTRPCDMLRRYSRSISILSDRVLLLGIVRVRCVCGCVRCVWGVACVACVGLCAICVRRLGSVRKWK